MACRSEAGLIVDTLPVQTEPSLPPSHTYTHTPSQLHRGPDRHFDLCLATNKKREQNQLAITALSTGLSPPGSRVLKIKDHKSPYNTSIPLHILIPTGKTQISAQSPYTQLVSKLCVCNTCTQGRWWPGGQRSWLVTEVTMAEIARQAGKLWVEKVATTATTPLSKVPTSIWLTESAVVVLGLLQV